VKENKSLISELSNIEQTMKELKIALESNDQYKRIDNLLTYKEITEGKTGNLHHMLVALRNVLFLFTNTNTRVEQLESQIKELQLQVETKNVHYSELEMKLKNMKKKKKKDVQNINDQKIYKKL